MSPSDLQRVSFLALKRQFLLRMQLYESFSKEEDPSFFTRRYAKHFQRKNSRKKKEGDDDASAFYLQHMVSILSMASFHQNPGVNFRDFVFKCMVPSALHRAKLMQPLVKQLELDKHNEEISNLSTLQPNQRKRKQPTSIGASTFNSHTHTANTGSIIARTGSIAPTKPSLLGNKKPPSYQRFHSSSLSSVLVPLRGGSAHNKNNHPHAQRGIPSKNHRPANSSSTTTVSSGSRTSFKSPVRPSLRVTVQETPVRQKQRHVTFQK